MFYVGCSVRIKVLTRNELIKLDEYAFDNIGYTSEMFKMQDETYKIECISNDDNSILLSNNFWYHKSWIELPLNASALKMFLEG